MAAIFSVVSHPSEAQSRESTPRLDEWAASMREPSPADAEHRARRAELWYDMVLEWTTRVESTTPPDANELVVQVENLNRALQTSRRIGAAIGILMASSKLTEEAAFELLTHVSQRTHRKLRDVADAVVLTGRLPTTSESGQATTSGGSGSPSVNDDVSADPGAEAEGPSRPGQSR